MNKVIILSVRPEWLAKIMNGEKTIEIRKDFPKNIELPATVLLYCTKEKPYLAYDSVDYDDSWGFPTSSQGYFLYKNKYDLENNRDEETPALNGLIPCKFTLNKGDKLEIFDDGCITIVNGKQDGLPYKESCLTHEQFCEYLGYGDDTSLGSETAKGYAWHIDDLEIFDNSMELGEFYGILNDPKCIAVPTDPLKRAPQSWQYAYLESGK